MTTSANPANGKFECACGRSFDSQAALAEHEKNCEGVKAKQGDQRDAGRAAEERPVPSKAEGEDI
jgi:hypothetical protein